MVGHATWLDSVEAETNPRPQVPVAPESIGGIATFRTQISIRILSVFDRLARSELRLLAAWAPNAEKSLDADPTHLFLESALLGKAGGLGLEAVRVSLLEEHIFAGRCLRMQGDNSR